MKEFYSNQIEKCKKEMLIYQAELSFISGDGNSELIEDLEDALALTKNLLMFYQKRYLEVINYGTK